MTVAVGTGRSPTWTADGTNRNWGFPFKVLKATHVLLEITDGDGFTSEVSGPFTVMGLGADEGGYVIYPILPAPTLPAGYKIRVVRRVPLEQPNRIGNQGGFHARTHEDTMDLLAQQVQQLREDGTARGITAPFDDGGLDMRLSGWSNRAGKLLEFDSAGRPATINSVSGILSTAKGYSDAVHDELSSRTIIVTADAEYSSRTVALSAKVPASVSFLRAAGYALPGDGGAALYKRVAAPGSPAAWHFQSADGAWWELSEPAANSLMFGAKGDGIADDTAALSRFIAWINRDPSRPVRAELSPGTYKVTSALPPIARGDVNLSAAGATILFEHPTQDALTIYRAAGPISNITISGLTIRSTVARADGCGINMLDIRNVLLSNVRIFKQFRGIACGVFSYVYLQDGVVLDENHIGVEINFGDGFFMDGIRINGSSGTSFAPGSVGVLIHNGGGINFDGFDVTRCEVGLSLAPGDGQAVSYLFIGGAAFDSCGYGLYGVTTGTGEIKVIKAGGESWFSSNEANGVYLRGAVMVNLSGAHVMLNKKAGAIFEQCQAVVVDGAHIMFNNVSDEANGTGLHLLGSTDVQISGCQISNRALALTGAYLQKTGVTVDGVSSRVSITGNQFSGHPLNDISIPIVPAGFVRIEGNTTDKSDTLTAVSDITVPLVYDVVYITGATPIANISTQKIKGKRLTFVYIGTGQIADTFNFALAGDFTATAGSTLSVICNGTQWSETARAVV